MVFRSRSKKFQFIFISISLSPPLFLPLIVPINAACMFSQKLTKRKPKMNINTFKSVRIEKGRPRERKSTFDHNLCGIFM